MDSNFTFVDISLLRRFTVLCWRIEDSRSWVIAEGVLSPYHTKISTRFASEIVYRRFWHVTMAELRPSAGNYFVTYIVVKSCFFLSFAERSGLGPIKVRYQEFEFRRRHRMYVFLSCDLAYCKILNNSLFPSSFFIWPGHRSQTMTPEGGTKCILSIVISCVVAPWLPMFLRKICNHLQDCIE